jgi:hypothetical protein
MEGKENELDIKSFTDEQLIDEMMRRHKEYHSKARAYDSMMLLSNAFDNMFKKPK